MGSEHESISISHVLDCPSVQCPVSVLSHSVESCGTCLRRPCIVFHSPLFKLPFVFTVKTDMLIDKTEMLIDKTDMLIDKTDMLIDKTDMLIDKTDMLIDKTDKLSDFGSFVCCFRTDMHLIVKI